MIQRPKGQFFRLNLAIIFALVIAFHWAILPLKTLASELPDLGDPSSAILSPQDDYRLGQAFMRNLRQNVEIIEDPERETLHQKIGRMTVAEKINAALMGNQEERTILVRDSNKIVARAVLQSPKLSDQEAENIATMKNVSEEVLRLVAMNRKFIRSYSVARNLINNPRTPVDTGLPLLHRLNDRDLKELARNKNVAEVIRSMANKMVKQKEQANKPKLPGKH